MVYIIAQLRKQLAKLRTNLKRHFAHFAENIAIVSESVAEDSNVSIPRRSQEIVFWDIVL